MAVNDRIVRFLTALGIEDPNGYDMEFLAITKDLFEKDKLLMVIEKQTPWTYAHFEAFSRGLIQLSYPVEITFRYNQFILAEHVSPFFHDWFEATYHHPFPGTCRLTDAELMFIWHDEGQQHAFASVRSTFADVMLFLHYDITVTESVEIQEPKVNAAERDTLNQRAKEIALERQAEEDQEQFFLEHAETIKKEEERLVAVFEEDLKEQAFVEKEKRKKQVGDYELIRLEDIQYTHDKVEVEGTIYSYFQRQYQGRKVAKFVLGNASKGLFVTMQEDKNVDGSAFQGLKEGLYVRIRGGMTLDMTTKEPRLYVHEIVPTSPPGFLVDDAKEKRVELHLHSAMSTMDGIGSMDAYAALAKAMGHSAFAVTDHGVVQAFPEAQKAAEKHGLKMIYGCEMYMVDQAVSHIMHPSDRHLMTTDYVIFDLETTGLSSRYDRIIEFGGVRVRDGEIMDRLSLLIHPEAVPLSATASQISGITMAMLEGQPAFHDVAQSIRDFLKDAILLSHNAPFDIGFLKESFSRLGEAFSYPVIDTLTLSRHFYPEAKSHRLGALAKRLDVAYDEEKAHRAIYDAEVLVAVWLALRDKLMAMDGITTHADLEKLQATQSVLQNQRPYHISVLARNADGLKALYQLVSLSHLDYFSDIPRIPRQKIIEKREHLLLGSACMNGEVFEKARTQSKEALEEAMRLYDYIEIMPLEHYAFLVHTGAVSSMEEIQRILNDIIDIAKKLNKLIVATGDVHYPLPEDKPIRDVYISAKGLKGVPHPLNPYYRKDLPVFDNPDAHFRSTNDMLAAFSWLPEEEAYAYVVTHSQTIANMIEPIKPIQAKLKTPRIEGVDEKLKERCYQRAYQQYGNPLPLLIAERLEKELHGIIVSGYAVIYYITATVIAKANQAGFIVGSRGSVGSSFAATMAGITEVNPLPPHYYCPTCQHVEFNEDPQIKSGFDLPTKQCPRCHQTYRADGQNIPFATFLGFNADKVPDIDLNFPRDYQAIAHEETAKLLGDNAVYRAGTIETVAEKTAFGYVKGYFESIGVDERSLSQATLTVLAKRVEGVRRTSGQHPGGIVVVPKEFDVHDFTPIQRPADNQETSIITTHFAFEALHDALLKFDMLGHVDPMALKMMSDLTNIPIEDIPLNDPDALSVFASDAPLIRKEKYLDVSNGAMGLPEFGTLLGMDILNVIQPKTFNDLVIISGLAHGTDVFNGNARELIEDKVATVDQVIGCRDDIMTYLMSLGIDSLVAFRIMEDVRKGKGLTPEYEAAMRAVNVPTFYIQSCKKIKYLFPKAHAVAYVTMAVRVAYFKVHHPLAYYATYFTLRSKQYDYDAMLMTPKQIYEKLEDFKRMKATSRKRLSPKDADIEVTLMNVLEMKERGYHMLPLDLEKSSATAFQIDEARQGILPPFIVLDGLGEAAANSVVEARQQQPFLSVDDLKNRTKLSKTNIDHMKQRGVLDQLDRTETISLFSFDA